ncbi:MAG TPA: hypothetical protein VEU29_02545 [Actinomycetota bacterium]|nr:hypothetical protein [Actinomycetota bacterium]
MNLCIAIINGTPYRVAEDVQTVGSRIRRTFEADTEVQLPIETPEGTSASLHLLPRSVGTFAVYEVAER